MFTSWAFRPESLRENRSFGHGLWGCLRLGHFGQNRCAKTDHLATVYGDVYALGVSARIAMISVLKRFLDTMPVQVYTVQKFRISPFAWSQTDATTHLSRPSYGSLGLTL